MVDLPLDCDAQHEQMASVAGCKQEASDTASLLTYADSQISANLQICANFSWSQLKHGIEADCAVDSWLVEVCSFEEAYLEGVAVPYQGHLIHSSWPARASPCKLSVEDSGNN